MDFVEENRGMARRALWLLQGNLPTKDVPELPLSKLGEFVDAEGFLLPLAAFAFQRNFDAQRDEPMERQGESADLTDAVRVGEAKAKLVSSASRTERWADEHLRQAVSLLAKTAASWQSAIDARAEASKSMAVQMPFPVEFGETPLDDRGLIIGLDLTNLAAAAAAAQCKVEEYRRELPTRLAFPSLCGLPQAERKLQLDAQALRLHESGVSLDHIAFVMGWDDVGSDEGRVELLRDRTRNRLALARERVRSGGGAPSPGSVSGSEV